MEEMTWMALQSELFPLERPLALLTDERRDALIPLLAMIVAAAMVSPAAATDSLNRPPNRGRPTSSSESATMMVRAARRPAPGLVFHSPPCSGSGSGSGAAALPRPIRVVTERRQDPYAKRGMASPKATIPAMIAHVGSHGATRSAPTPMSRSTTSVQMTTAIFYDRTLLPTPIAVNLF